VISSKYDMEQRTAGELTRLHEMDVDS